MLTTEECLVPTNSVFLMEDCSLIQRLVGLGPLAGNDINFLA